MKGAVQMTQVRTSLAVAVVSAGVAIAGCGGSGGPKVQPSGKLENVAGSSVGQIVLTQVGAQRIGLQTTAAQAVRGSAAAGSAGGGHTVMVPYGAIVYSPTGVTYTFKQVGPLTFVEVPVTVDHITGNSAYLIKGPPAGASVVTVGAEELYGVQTGVLAQT